MTTAHAVVIVALAGAMGLAGDGASAAQDRAAATSGMGFDAARLGGVERFIEQRVNAGELPGAVLLLARHGRVATLRAMGSARLAPQVAMRTDSLFRLASASKIVTTVGLLLLYEEGRFALGDPVDRYLPEFRGLRVRHPDGTVQPATRRLTIRDLLRHTSGYGYGSDAAQRTAYQQAELMPAEADDDWTHRFTLQEWSARLASVPLDAEPGQRFEYGLGADIAGALIERLSGARLDVFLRQRVFEPLGMADTGFVVAPSMLSRMTTVYRARPGGFDAVDEARTSRFLVAPRALSGGGGWDMVGYGGLLSTAPDFFRFLQMLLNHGTLNEVRLLTRSSVDLMFRNHLDGLATPERSPGVGFGLGYAIVTNAARYGETGSEGLIWWAGSANTRYWIDPHSQTIGIYFTQVLPFPYLDLMGTVMRLALQAVE